MSKYASKINKLFLAAMFLALGWLFPFITGQIPQVGNMFLPMHIPVFLCGFILGPWYGLLIGFITPLTRFAIFFAPPLFPTGIAMAFELATYGFVSGFLFRRFINTNKLMPSIYFSLFLSMILGRVVWGLAQYFIGLFGNLFTIQMFISGAFIMAWPGIIIQLIIIPIIIRTLYNSGLLNKYFRNKNSLSNN